MPPRTSTIPISTSGPQAQAEALRAEGKGENDSAARGTSRHALRRRLSIARRAVAP